MKNLKEYVNESLVYEKKMENLHITKKEAEEGDEFVDVPAKTKVDDIETLEKETV